MVLETESARSLSPIGSASHDGLMIDDIMMGMHI